MSVRSMTGFAAVRRGFDGAEISLSVKAVNHRSLDAHFHLPPEFDAFETALRGLIKQHVVRGHLQVQVKFTSTRRATPVAVNLPLLDGYLTAFRRAAAVHGLHGEPDLNAAFALPGMLEMAEEEGGLALEPCLVTALQEALALLNQQREREGRHLALELRARNAAVRECALAMEEQRARALPAFQVRLQSRLAELLEVTAIDPQRLAQEVAYLADRSDITEELLRLKVHAGQVQELLDQGGEIGKKLDFLLQEMQRETNTVLAKTAGIGEFGLAISGLALSAKAEIEKIREQALNLE